MIVFAHAGHWLAGIAYAAPVVVLAGWLAVVKVKDRLGGARVRATGPDRPD